MTGKKKLINDWIARLKIPSLLDHYWGNERLTVLNYHRIADVTAPDFVGFAPNVSTTAQGFEMQMQYVKSNFNVIGLDALVAYLYDDVPLPERPLMITFDDGYLDNYDVAFPILQKYELPAVIFLLTSRMTDTYTMPWWDACFEAMNRTDKTDIVLPEIGTRQLHTPQQNLAVAREMIQHLKQLPESDKLTQLNKFVETLDVDLTLSKPLFITWDQVRDLVAGGVACQPHTHTHPIMTRISKEQVYDELRTSKTLIEQETDQQAIAFAYPNGMVGDFDETTFDVLRDLDYKVAFTLLSGPTSFAMVKQYPYQIKRIFLSHHDNFKQFVAKTMGVPALLGGEPFLKTGQ